MSGWQWALVLPAAGLVIRGLYIAFTGHKATTVTYVNGVKYVEHEEPASGRGLGAALAFAGAAVLLIATTDTELGSWARRGLKAKDAVESTYALWAWRVFLPLFVVGFGLGVALLAVTIWESVRDGDWDQALICLVALGIAAAVTCYLAWFWWGLVT
jgi:hypothetical protein